MHYGLATSHPKRPPTVPRLRWTPQTPQHLMVHWTR
jgi:hypothetical protein